MNAMIAFDGPCSVLRPKNTNLLTDVRAVQRIMSLLANLSVHTTSTKYKINPGQLTPIWISWNWPKTSAWIRELSAQNCSLESKKIRPDLIDWNTEEDCDVMTGTTRHLTGMDCKYLVADVSRKNCVSPYKKKPPGWCTDWGRQARARLLNSGPRQASAESCRGLNLFPLLSYYSLSFNP